MSTVILTPLENLGSRHPSGPECHSDTRAWYGSLRAIRAHIVCGACVGLDMLRGSPRLNLLGGRSGKAGDRLEIILVFAPALGFSLPEGSSSSSHSLPGENRHASDSIDTDSVRVFVLSNERRNQLFTSIYLLTNNKDHAHIKIPLGNQRRILGQSR